MPYSTALTIDTQQTLQLIPNRLPRRKRRCPCQPLAHCLPTLADRLPAIPLDSIIGGARITTVSNKSGAVAQRESTSLARKGSGVQIASAPPFLKTEPLQALCYVSWVCIFCVKMTKN